MFGGWNTGGALYRDLWRFSLSDLQWEEIDVAPYADVSTGVWFDGKLVFVGRCPSGAIYDPERDTWNKLTSTEAPPGRGKMFAAGDTLFVSEPVYEGQSTDGIFALNLDDDYKSGGGVIGGASGAGGAM
jgi:hypothetical protein